MTVSTATIKQVRSTSPVICAASGRPPKLWTSERNKNSTRRSIKANLVSLFSGSLRPAARQVRLVSPHGAESNVKEGNNETIRILKSGFPSSKEGIESAVELSLSLEQVFKMKPLECEPFIHGYGEFCSEPKLTVAICDLILQDLMGNSFSIAI